MAVITLFLCFPLAISLRNRPHNLTCAFQAISRTGCGSPSCRLSTWALFLVALGCVTGCQSPYVGPTTVPSGVDELPILWQASGTYSRLTRAVRLVIRDPAMLAQVPLCEVPPVDFRSQMVLIAGLGPTARNDLGIRIQSVWQERSRIRVLERQIYPGDCTESGPHPASPWTLVVVPLSHSSIEGYSTRPPRGLLRQGSPSH